MIEIDFSQFPPEVQGLLRTVQFGLDVAAFVTSPVGIYLLGRASQEREQALEALAYTDVADAEQIRELQLIVRRSDSLREWLKDAENDAGGAEAELQSREGE